MRRLASFVLVIALGMVSTAHVVGVSPVGSVTFGANRTMTVCVDDPDNPPGTTQIVTMDIDNQLYDGFTMADGSCTTRGYAPFGPTNHTVKVWAVDSQGQAPTLLANSAFSEDCNVFPIAGDQRQWCNDAAGTQYYQNRQTDTKPLISDLVWAGVSTKQGGAIQQLYSRDRSFNLLNEHPGGSLQLSLWGASTTGNPLPPSAWGVGCNGNYYDPLVGNTLMNLIQTQGPNCAWSHPVDGYVYWGPTVGAATYVSSPDSHTRKWTLTNFHIWTNTYPVTDHIQVNYRFINDTLWDFTVGGQEMPALHMNPSMNDYYFWSQGGSYAMASPQGAQWNAGLYVPGISPYPNNSNPQIWTGSWISACDELGHCITVAPHDPPSAGGIVFGNLSSVVPANMLTLQGEYAIPRGTDKGWKVYIFPYAFWESPNGVNVLTRLQQLRGWL